MNDRTAPSDLELQRLLLANPLATTEEIQDLVGQSGELPHGPRGTRMIRSRETQRPYRGVRAGRPIHVGIAG
jgi:hypothetical protein